MPRPLGIVVALLAMAAALLVDVPTTAVSAPDGTPGDGRLVTMRLSADGELTVVAVAAAEVDLPPTEPAWRARDAVRDAVTVEVSTGDATYRRTVPVERTLRAELPVRGSARPTGRTAPVGDVVFTVALPAAAPTGAVRVTDLRTGRTAAATSLQPAAARAAAGPRLVRLDGYPLVDSPNRLDIAILGDGYVAGDAAEFAADAKRLADRVLSITPYAEYAHLFNVVGVFAPSAERGADLPAYVPGAAGDITHPVVGCPDPTARARASYVNTRYDSSYCYHGVQRLLVPIDRGRVRADASAAFPQWDQLMMVVNDATYGGSGGEIATTSLDPDGAHILRHELGHSLLGLDDEYTTRTPGYPPCSDIGRAGIKKRCDPNVTDAKRRSALKWRRWVSASTPIPTRGPAGPGVVGLFLGAHYSPDTWYRSCFNCLMRTLRKPFGAVSAEQLPVRLYTGGWQGPAGSAGRRLQLIEPGTASPSAGSVVVPAGASQAFSVKVLGPAGSHTRVRWQVDGVDVQTRIVGSGTTDAFTLSGDGGAHTVTVQVTDVGGILHPSRAALSASVQQWRVTP